MNIFNPIKKWVKHRSCWKHGWHRELVEVLTVCTNLHEYPDCPEFCRISFLAKCSRCGCVFETEQLFSKKPKSNYKDAVLEMLKHDL
jgi:hypothetical protein